MTDFRNFSLCKNYYPTYITSLAGPAGLAGYSYTTTFPTRARAYIEVNKN